MSQTFEPPQPTRVRTNPIFFSRSLSSAKSDAFGFSAVSFARTEIYVPSAYHYKNEVRLTRLILSFNFAYSHKTSCSREES